MDFVYVIMISAIAGANRGTVIEAARKAAKDGGLEAASEAARKAASEAETTTTIQVVARLARIAGISVDGPAKRARAAADVAAKAEKARAICAGLNEDEARASAAAKATEAYASSLPAKMREALGGRRIPSSTVLEIRGGRIDGEGGLPAISGAVLGAFAHNGVKLAPSFAAAAANIVVPGGFALRETIPAKKPAECGRFDAVADVEWANQPGHVVYGVLTGYAPVEGYRIELHVPDLIGDIGQDGLKGLARLLQAGEIVVPRTTIFQGAVEMTTAEELEAKAKAASDARVVSIDDAIKSAFSIAPGKKPKARPKAAKPRK